jgi:hypothetical protein
MAVSRHFLMMAKIAGPVTRPAGVQLLRMISVLTRMMNRKSAAACCAAAVAVAALFPARAQTQATTSTPAAAVSAPATPLAATNGSSPTGATGAPSRATAQVGAGTSATGRAASRAPAWVLCLAAVSGSDALLFDTSLACAP